ncbi:glutamine--fructose-6-phosphate transaminase (isomerizing) [Marinicauda salina]|uniref:Glutamine--fructose-6-phosphate aminotransferase [isomerizing] n=1 Tax=Marinicauda salina TaxID=2135793 RepID=A0A2U2BXG2_9PROT|nr:glutamine--fructose-6-phosphate transaminase (isomerizing) [Marinicauda salina]PWE18687.1 glutamine--fructose-6-phosphate transaminase (isomerizing) [Marinicauda salina]
MCGIIGIVGTAPVTERLLSGLKRLEYRGYDSAGIAVLDRNGELQRRRAEGKLSNLEAVVRDDPLEGFDGIAHTRWATHGAPTERNAHPHAAGPVAIVHNGIIENYRELEGELKEAGYNFESDTDSEVIAHLIRSRLEGGLDMTSAFDETVRRLRGAYAIAAMCADEPGRIWAAREGSPLVIGLGEQEAFVGSDAFALAGLSRRLIYLEDGDCAEISRAAITVRDSSGREVSRDVKLSEAVAGYADKGEYRHFMEKEIHEQPDAIARTLSRYVDAGYGRFTVETGVDWRTTERLFLTACGTALYAGAIAKYWFESLAQLPVEADVASEFRYREPVVREHDAAVFISQSGETADTLAALRYVKASGADTVAVVNVPESTIAREAKDVILTEAGPEIGVASTKAFTAQLTALACLAGSAAEARGQLDAEGGAALVDALVQAPRQINEAFRLEPKIQQIAHTLARASNVLYLGRGVFFPLALEGALKLKEISYIHAGGYAAGELKHGPIALIEDGTPVVVVAPSDPLFEKTCSNMQEVRARGAHVILITDPKGAQRAGELADEVLVLPDCPRLIQPIVAAAPLQMIAYHTAALKGTDIDQPRNLAKSVTVE